MVFMAVCNRWKDLCNGSDFMKQNCEKTCEVCKPGNASRLFVTIATSCKKIHLFSIILLMSLFDSVVACEWDEFSSWTTCTKTCGGGTQVRQRQVKVPAQFGGEACEGGQAEQRVCNEQGCPSKYFCN